MTTPSSKLSALGWRPLFTNYTVDERRKLVRIVGVLEDGTESDATISLDEWEAAGD